MSAVNIDATSMPKLKIPLTIKKFQELSPFLGFLFLYFYPTLRPGSLGKNFPSSDIFRKIIPTLLFFLGLPP